MEQKQAARWLKKCLFAVFGAIFGVIAVCYLFDPYFHYHKPFSFVSYRLYYERYINDGISRHFDYDTIITGTSMAQNFKPSEMDSIFGTQSVKETFSGAGYQEISDNLDRALTRNPELTTIVWALDYNGMIRDKNWTQYEDYPTYLYDDNLWNDVSYLFNKSIFYHGVFHSMIMTLTDSPSTTMDEYSAWEKETGLQYILESYDRTQTAQDIPATLEAEEETVVRENITENIVELVNRYPDTTFYLFFTPYSICYWDSLKQEGSMERQFQAQELTTRLLLDCPNVRLYSFFDCYDIICNTDYYRDKEHYSDEVNSMILAWLAQDQYLVTWDNYQEKLAQQMEFYRNYDYDSIYTAEKEQLEENNGNH